MPKKGVVALLRACAVQAAQSPENSNQQPPTRAGLALTPERLLIYNGPDPTSGDGGFVRVDPFTGVPASSSHQLLPSWGG
jgi:hypothetical protein